ncbi:hypothetical protein GCM10010483_59790 [Actinokineospora diospyrosa]
MLGVRGKGFGPPPSAPGVASSPGGNIGGDPRQCDKLDGANLFCAGPLQHPWQNRKAGAQKQALPLTTLRVLSPHAKQVRPIEPAWHQRVRLSRRWEGGLGRT